ncbi:N-acetylmuramoyl-L-alanine amidase [Marinilactibacillus piezotolerans]|uniref:N-acetylmuramoyl-L-alanine amidase n=1 Tax=Marinilactibacillus piezotolerans TaxID=258723 RepID=A0A1I3YZI0_9LACT|nr:GW dipeptide domain-containing protein [Marinilactibacillus piezotolerans]SFK37267.1 N-acetylmuramoyl-L-alanine amidase [Marinilactibacillus piezotolerans]
MASKKKGKRRALLFSTIVTLLSPIFLSSVASASEVNNSDVTTQVEEGEFLDDDSQKTDSSTKVENEINASDTVEENSEEEESHEKEEVVSESISDQDVYSKEDTREKAMEMMEENQVSTYSIQTRMVSKTDAFINAISNYAVAIAEENNLYASVMIAQAALESAWGTSILAYNPNFNLFGIKGSYNGQTFYKYTKEYSNEDGWTTIKAGFKKYPSYAESLIDYADKLRNGPVSMSKDYYKGTWKENATAYQDATKWLTGRYATDPEYNTKLNSIISTYDLTRFDQMPTEENDTSDNNLQNNLESTYSDEVITTSSVNYRAYITGDTDGIYSAPKNTKDSKVNTTTLEYFNKNVTVTQEKKTKNGLTWALITLDGKQLGWIDKSGLSVYEQIISEKSNKFVAIVKRGTDNIGTRPYGTEGYKKIEKSSAYLNEQVNVSKEIKTSRSTYVLISIGNKEIGWVDKNALDIETVLTEKKVDYTSYVTRGTDNVTTKPYGVEGYNVISKSSNYLDKKVQVTNEVTTRRSTYVLISENDKEIGWIDKNALTSYDDILSEKDTNFAAIVKRGTDNVGTQPYGTKGYKKITKSSTYLNKEVYASKEIKTVRSTYVLISVDGKEIGWVDKNALDIEEVLTEKDVDYVSNIIRGTDNITTEPYGVEGFSVITKSSNYLGKKVQAIKEITTRRSTYVLIYDGNEEIGWVDKNALGNYEPVLSEKETNFVAIVKRGTDNIGTNPYGTKGYNYITKSSKYLNKQVNAIREVVTSRSTYILISINGKEIGWIDKNALDIEKVLEEKAVNYSRYISRGTDNVTTKPYGVEGFAVKSKSSSYLGNKVKAVKEVTTRRSTYVLIYNGNKEIGWIDKNALTETVLSEKNINYSAKIKRGTDNFGTDPYATEDYSYIAKSSKYLNKQVKVLKEAVTYRSTYALISIDGKEIGWVDKNALDIEKVLSEKDVTDYKARIVRNGDSVSTKPWGTEGYTVKAYSQSYLGAEVTVKKEATTRRSTYVLVALNGKELGWIDKAALKKLDPNKRVVVIDAGHGGSDPGAQAGGVKEKDLNLTVSKKVQTKLKNAGYEVIMTRSTDVFVELSERARIANTSSADIFVSIHTNSFDSTANGIETYSYNASGNANNPVVANDPDRLLKSSLLSEAIQDALLEETGAYDRGVKEANFHVIRETGMAAVLTEMGFIDNSAERAKLVKDSYQNQIADGIVLGIKEYFKIFK